MVVGAVASLLVVPACAEQLVSSPISVTPSAGEVALTPAPKPPELVDFALNRTCEAPPRITCPLKIVGVRIASSETTVTLRFEMERPGIRARIWPPGHPSAFHIRDSSGREHKLLRVEGVATASEVIAVAPGISTEVKLVFEPVPLQTKAFDLLEGEPEAGFPTKTFRFMDVRLDSSEGLLNKAMDPTSARVEPSAHLGPAQRGVRNRSSSPERWPEPGSWQGEIEGGGSSHAHKAGADA